MIDLKNLEPNVAWDIIYPAFSREFIWESKTVSEFMNMIREKFKLSPEQNLYFTQKYIIFRESILDSRKITN